MADTITKTNPRTNGTYWYFESHKKSECPRFFDRLGDVNARIDDMGTNLARRIDDVNTNLSKRIEEVNTNLSKRIEEVNTNLSQRLEDVSTTLNHRMDGLDKRMDGLDNRMDGLEVRLANRVSTWVAIVLPVLTVILGFLLGHVHL